MQRVDRCRSLYPLVACHYTHHLLNGGLLSWLFRGVAGAEHDLTALLDFAGPGQHVLLVGAVTSPLDIQQRRHQQRSSCHRYRLLCDVFKVTASNPGESRTLPTTFWHRPTRPCFPCATDIRPWHHSRFPYSKPSCSVWRNFLRLCIPLMLPHQSDFVCLMSAPHPPRYR